MKNIPIILPFLPVIGWTAVAITGLFITKKVFFSESDAELAKGISQSLSTKSQSKIAILGHHSAGKTTFLKYLKGDRNYKNKHRASGYDEYERFTLQIGEKNIIIDKNVDIGGGQNFVREYKGVLKDAKLAFYFFDISKFLNDTEYFRDFGARVDYLKDITTLKVFFIGTHPDLMDPNLNLKIKISEKLGTKGYRSFVEYNLFILNLMDDRQLKEFVDITFKGC